MKNLLILLSIILSFLIADIEDPIPGCTDASSCSNYSEDANIDDGTCTTNINGTCYYNSDLNALVAFAQNSGLSTDLTDVIDMGSIHLWVSERLLYWDCSNCGFSGAIPSEVGNLTELTSLNLSLNSLSGSIPSGIGNLTKLTSLNLSQNNTLTGSIPSEIGNLTQLFSLYINNNQLDGSIPSEIGQLSLLNYLSLGNNLLTGTIPTEIDNLTSLVYLSFANNNLTGLIPSSLCNYSTSSVSNNQFCLPYPSCDGTPITTEIEGNQDTSNCPDCLESSETTVYDTGYMGCYNNGDLAFLQALINNSPGGENNPPSSLSPWKLGHQLWDNKRLTTFCCSSSSWNLSTFPQWSGSNCQSECPYEFGTTIPSNIENLTALDKLALAGMNLEGTIPDGLTDLAALEVLVLIGNESLSGSLPESIGNLQNLKHLHLKENILSGEIPSSLWTITDLISLDLGNNQYSGTISIADLNFSSSFQNLKWLDLANNNFSGEIPANICNMNLISSFSEQFEFDDNAFCPPYPTCIDEPENQTITMCIQDCAGTYGGDLVVDQCGLCGGDNTSCADECGVPNGDNTTCADDCSVPNGPNTDCSNPLTWSEVDGSCPNKDKYCGRCFGTNTCLAQLKSYEPIGSLIDINTDSIRFHFSVPIKYTSLGIEIKSRDNSDIDFSVKVVQDSIIRIKLNESFISNDQITITLDPCKIKNDELQNIAGNSWCLDTDSTFSPPSLGNVETPKEITKNISLLGDYDLDGHVNEEDLDTLLTYWKTENYSYELGPWTWGFQTDAFMKAPWLQPVKNSDGSKYDSVYDIHDLIAFVKMWNYDNQNLQREIKFESTIDYVPEYNFAHNQMILNLNNFPGGIKRVWLQLYVNDNNIEIENAVINSQFDIVLNNSQGDYGIYDWVIGSFSPLVHKNINLFNIISKPKNDQSLKLSYEIIDFNQEISAGEIDIKYNSKPQKVTITPPYPNPFNPVTSFKYSIPQKSDVSIEIYNITGRLIDKTEIDDREVGDYTYIWDGSNYSNGIYLVRIKISDTIKSYRIILLK